MAAQMSHESRELAEVYSTERVERAQHFLRQRQEEADRMAARVSAASATCRELKGWLERVEIDEDCARSALARFREELEPLIHLLDLGPVGASGSNVEIFSQRTFAAE
jgi:hypothetical protein